MERNQSTLAMMELAALVMQDVPGSKLYQVIDAVYDLQRLARSLHRRYEAQCSYQWADTAAYSTRTDNMEAKAVKIGAEIGIAVELQRDPRGWPVIVKIAGREVRLG